MIAIADFIRKLPTAFRAADSEGANCTLQFNVSTPMYAVINGGPCTVHEGTAPESDLSMQMSDDDFVELFIGKLDGISAYMSGKLSLKGDLMLAQRVGGFFDTSKLG